jgi:hypothetical protein
MLVATVAACSKDSTGPSTLDVTGNWTATPTGDFTPGGSATINLALSQSGSTVTGTGTISDPTSPPPGNFTVTGTVTGANVALTIQVQPQVYQNATIDVDVPAAPFNGILTSSTMNGTLTIGDPGHTITFLVNFTKQ